MYVCMYVNMYIHMIEPYIEPTYTQWSVYRYEAVILGHNYHPRVVGLVLRPWCQARQTLVKRWGSVHCVIDQRDRNWSSNYSHESKYIYMYICFCFLSIFLFIDLSMCCRYNVYVMCVIISIIIIIIIIINYYNIYIIYNTK